MKCFEKIYTFHTSCSNYYWHTLYTIIYSQIQWLLVDNPDDFNLNSLINVHTVTKSYFEFYKQIIYRYCTESYSIYVIK